MSRKIARRSLFFAEASGGKIISDRRLRCSIPFIFLRRIDSLLVKFVAVVISKRIMEVQLFLMCGDRMMAPVAVKSACVLDSLLFDTQQKMILELVDFLQIKINDSVLSM